MDSTCVRKTALGLLSFVFVAAVFSPAAAAQSVTSASAPPAFQGSVPAVLPSSGSFPLSLSEAIERGLRSNLGAISADDAFRQAEGRRTAALSQLLPNVSGYLREVDEQLNLASFGFKFNIPPSLGFTIPSIVGPFNYFDLRATLTQRLVDVSSLRSYQSSREDARAGELSAKDAREIVVTVVASGYMQAIAMAARVDSAQAQATTAQAIFQQASDRFAAGLNARIDVTRSKVELQTVLERLTQARADEAKQRIAFARLIGLPPGQNVTLADSLPYAPMENMTLEQAIELAAQNRADLKAAEAELHAAELSRKAVSAERLPVLDFSGDYGAIGPTPSNSHGTFTAVGELRFPIWQGGRVRGELEQADAVVAQRRAEYQNLRAQVEADVRSAFLDLNAAAEQVSVAQSRRELAQDELRQSRDRFASGVADTVEVVQAQEMVASAEQDYIASLYAHNLAKAGIARAVGQAEKLILVLLRRP